jgi:hypothetical protein
MACHITYHSVSIIIMLKVSVVFVYFSVVIGGNLQECMLFIKYAIPTRHDRRREKQAKHEETGVTQGWIRKQMAVLTERLSVVLLMTLVAGLVSLLLVRAGVERNPGPPMDRQVLVYSND